MQLILTEANYLLKIRFCLESNLTDDKHNESHLFSTGILSTAQRKLLTLYASSYLPNQLLHKLSHSMKNVKCKAHPPTLTEI